MKGETMVTLEHVMLLGLGLIVMTILTYLAVDIVDFVEANVRLLLGS